MLALLRQPLLKSGRIFGVKKFAQPMPRVLERSLSSVVIGPKNHWAQPSKKMSTWAPHFDNYYQLPANRIIYIPYIQMRKSFGEQLFDLLMSFNVLLLLILVVKLGLDVSVLEKKIKDKDNDDTSL